MATLDGTMEEQPDENEPGSPSKLKRASGLAHATGFPGAGWRCAKGGSELGPVLRLGWPNSVNLFLSFLPGMAMLAFLGGDTEELAAAGMGFMFGNVSGKSMIIGFGAGAQPLISQAFGARNYTRCGALLQRQLAIHVLVVLAVGVVWLLAEHVLVAFKQPSNIAALTGQFLRWRLAGLPFDALTEDFRSYLIAQRVMHGPMAISAVANILNIALFPLLIRHFGFVGAPLAVTVANIVQGSLSAHLSRHMLPVAEAWPKWDLRTAFSGWLEMIKVALPAAIMMLSEWWGWETTLFFAGMLCRDGQESCVELDAYPIASNTMVQSFMMHFGFSLAASTLVGNLLGAGEPLRARRVCYETIMLVSALSGAIAFVLIVVRRRWGLLFSNDAATVELTGQVLPYVAVYVFLDALGPGALVRIMMCMGYVRLPALVCFVSFYVVGIPCGLFLTFGLPDQRWSIMGLWAGLVVAMLFMVVSLLAYLLLFIDWQEAADAAQAQAAQQPCTGAETPPSALQGQRTVLGKRRYARVDDDRAQVAEDTTCGVETQTLQLWPDEPPLDDMGA